MQRWLKSRQDWRVMSVNGLGKGEEMKHDYTVERPNINKRRYLRNAIKAKLKLKKKLGYKKHEPAYDKDLATKSNTSQN